MSVHNLVSTEHSHEPGIPRVLDDDGRCLVCLLFVAIEGVELALAALREELRGRK